MPELPEVETVRRGLAANVVGRRIVRAEVGRANRQHALTHHDLPTQCVAMGQAFAEVESLHRA